MPDLAGSYGWRETVQALRLDGGCGKCGALALNFFVFDLVGLLVLVRLVGAGAARSKEA
ncbi:MAG: hypothetical protein RMK84_12340 [Oscillochloridaceae bacterium]|nr:hypothetical protein [Chloroflexaceae bacterium]MDW8390908.1 hypothetical protein [Oscillochloridaceae bacterium]